MRQLRQDDPDQPQMIYQTDLRTLGDCQCVVQVRQCLDGSIQQRHIWHMRGGEVDDPPVYDEWIASYTRRFDLAARGMTPAPDERDEFDEIVAALREIADGHNDARQRAIDALERAGLSRGA